MNRDEIWLAIDHERSTLADLLDDLSDQEWEVASLCSGWRVRDVAAHLTLAHMGVAQAARELLKVRGDINCMLHDTAVRQAELPVRQISALLRGMVGSRRKAPAGSRCWTSSSTGRTLPSPSDETAQCQCGPRPSPQLGSGP